MKYITLPLISFILYCHSHAADSYNKIEFEYLPQRGKHLLFTYNTDSNLFTLKSSQSKDRINFDSTNTFLLHHSIERKLLKQLTQLNIQSIEPHNGPSCCDKTLYYLKLSNDTTITAEIKNLSPEIDKRFIKLCIIFSKIAVKHIPQNEVREYLISQINYWNLYTKEN